MKMEWYRCLSHSGSKVFSLSGSLGVGLSVSLFFLSVSLLSRFLSLSLTYTDLLDNADKASKAPSSKKSPTFFC